MKLKSLILFVFITLNLSAISIGEIPKNVSIGGENGGLVSNKAPWNSSTIKDKVIVMFYVDPDEKDTNSHFSKKLKEEKFDKTKFASIAIVNLAATWKPNFVIETLLKSKQKEFPDTTYVKDKKSVLVNEWSLADDASDILLFAKDGRLLFYKAGKMSDEDISKVIKTIKDKLK